MNKKRWQLKIEAWLDGNKSEQLALYDDIAILKKERSFSRAFRIGIRLYISLKNRDISYLLEQFPWIQEALQDKNKGASSNGSGNGGYVMTEDTHGALQVHFEHMMDDYVMKHHTASNAVQSLHKPHHATPAYTLNDLPALQSKKATGDGNSRQRLLDSMSALSGTKPITYKPEIPKLAGIIAGSSDVTLTTPTFDSLEI